MLRHPVVRIRLILERASYLLSKQCARSLSNCTNKKHQCLWKAISKTETKKFILRLFRTPSREGVSCRKTTLRCDSSCQVDTPTDLPLLGSNCSWIEQILRSCLLETSKWCLVVLSNFRCLFQLSTRNDRWWSSLQGNTRKPDNLSQ